MLRYNERIEVRKKKCNFSHKYFLFNRRWKFEFTFELTCEGREVLWRKRKAIVSLLNYAWVNRRLHTSEEVWKICGSKCEKTKWKREERAALWGEEETALRGVMEEEIFLSPSTFFWLV